MGRYLKKSSTDFFKCVFLECGDGPQQHPINIYICLILWLAPISGILAISESKIISFYFLLESIRNNGDMGSISLASHPVTASFIF
jgi:hypothetical protein